MEQRVTERLSFRKVGPEDAQTVFHLMTQPAYIEHIGDRGLRTPEDARLYISEKMTYSPEGLGFYLVILQSSGDAIGIAGIVHRDFLDGPDLGYALLPEYEGCGYATEAASEVMNFAAEGLGLSVVGAILAPENSGSIRVLERIGMCFVKPVAFPGEDEPVHLYEKQL